ncbi:Uncharacterized protein pbN1_34060 [Aromatoleum bremense]|nr:Uncharacterized protein pbN1_34060 [Aromatoleum bremense]
MPPPASAVGFAILRARRRRKPLAPRSIDCFSPTGRVGKAVDKP